MKSGTEQKLKFLKLKKALSMPAWQVKGILQSVWDFTATNTPHGDIGRHTDDEIAMWIEYEGDAAGLVAVLTSTGWLDVHEGHRLVVHDWHDHCEEWVKKRVERTKKPFASAARPTASDARPTLSPMPSQAKPSPATAPRGRASAAADQEGVVKDLIALAPKLPKELADSLAEVFCPEDHRVLMDVFRSLKPNDPVRALHSLYSKPWKWGVASDPQTGRLKPPAADGERSPKREPTVAERAHAECVEAHAGIGKPVQRLAELLTRQQAGEIAFAEMVSAWEKELTSANGK